MQAYMRFFLPLTGLTSDSDMDDMGDEVQALLGYSQQSAASYDTVATADGDDDDASNQGRPGASGGGGGGFDPQSFFDSWQRSLGSEQTDARAAADVMSSSRGATGAAVADLQLSESDSDDDFEDVT